MRRYVFNPMISNQIREFQAPTILSIPSDNHSRSQKFLHIKMRRKTRQQNNPERNPRTLALRSQSQNVWLQAQFLLLALDTQGPEKYYGFQSPKARTQYGMGVGVGGATHAVVASFVVLILGFYMNGEFWQEGTLWKKRRFH